MPVTSNRSRWVVVAFATILTWSVALGAAMPAAAVSSSSGEGSVHHSLDLGGTVDAATGEADETNASDDEVEESAANDTETAETDDVSMTDVVEGTTAGLEGTVDEVVQTRTLSRTDEPEASTATPTPDPGRTPDPDSDGEGVDRAVGETVETAGGAPTPEETPAGADDADGGGDSVVGTTADVVDGVGTETTETVDGTVRGTTDAVQETTNASVRSVGTTTNQTGSAIDETARTATGDESEPAEAVDGVTDLTNETVGSTTRNAEETVGTVESSSSELTNATGETASSGSTGELATDTVGGVTRTVDATAAGTVDTTSAVTTTADETVGSSAELFDGGNGTVARLAENVTSSVDAATGGLTAVVDDTTRTVQRTTDAVTDGVDGTAETTGHLVDGAVDDDVAGGLFGPDAGDSKSAEAYGWPTEESGSSSDDGAAASEAVVRPGVGDDSAPPARLASSPTPVSEGSVDEPNADDTRSAGGESVLPALEEIDPAEGGAIAGALIVSGSVLATRAGMTASSMGAGAVTLPQLLFAMLREFALRLAVLAGYSRYDFSDPLENENRATVLETVEASPGINLTSLVEETGLAESTVRYHVRVLEHEGLLDGAKVRGRRRFVPQTNEDVELVAAFEEEATRDVIDALFEHEPATGSTLAEALDRDPSTVSHHLSRLSEAGLVEREQDGPALRNSLSADVRAALSDVEVTASVQQHVRADD